jgi:hypothetical protein
MPTRVFIPLTGRDSKDSSRTNSRVPSANTTPRKDKDKIEAKEADLKSEANTKRISDQKIETKSILSKSKPSTLRRTKQLNNINDNEYASKTISIEKQEILTKKIENLSLKRNDIINENNKKYDMKVPIGNSSNESHTTKHGIGIGMDQHHNIHKEKLMKRNDEKISSSSYKDDVNVNEEQIERISNEKKLISYKKNCTEISEKVFTFEPPKEKKLFHWVNHKAEMEETEPIAVLNYNNMKLNSDKLIKWKEKKSLLHNVRETENSPSTTNADTNLFDENNFENEIGYVKINHSIDDVLSKLGKKKNLFQETIASVFEESSGPAF